MLRARGRGLRDRAAGATLQFQAVIHMLSTLWPVFIVSLLALSCAIYAFFVARAAWIAANHGQATNVTRKWRAEVEAELTDLRDAYTALLENHKKLRSRVGMRAKRARDAGNGADPTHDLTTEQGRTAARTALEAELARAGRLNARGHTGG